MNTQQLLDTFPAFLAWRREAAALPLAEQAEGWARVYLAAWPELLRLQADSYAGDGLDWHAVVMERVLPHCEERLPRMREAHVNLLEACPEALEKARAELGFSGDLLFVIYAGAGCGAGWATTYEGRQAVLLGLENIAEEGWQCKHALRGLLGHEIGHLWHAQLRRRAGLQDGRGPFWQLYSEGVAQRCEHRIAGRETWHMAAADPGWLESCRAELPRLAAEFLRAADAGGDVRPFFGSWFSMHGRKQTGYFLGHEAVREMEKNHSLEQVALIEDVETACRAALQALTAGEGEKR